MLETPSFVMKEARFIVVRVYNASLQSHDTP